MSRSDSAPAQFAEIAVPVPLAGPLTYGVPDNLARAVRPGVRVRVRVGRRRLVGVVTACTEQAPEGIKVRPLDEVIDREPVLPESLLELGNFIAEYYVSPLGETLRTMLPADLPPWGDRRIWLTSAGALAPVHDEAQGQIIDLLRGGDRLRLSEILARVDRDDLHSAIEGLVSRGWVAVSDAGRRGSRYQTAVELASGQLEELLERCGRSAQGRRVVEFLSQLGRPATREETEAAVECSRSVLRRLEKLGVIRAFSQVSRLGMSHHRMARDTKAAIVLRPDQQEAYERLREACDGSSYGAFLLKGMTGSGKTEVYLRAADSVLQGGGGVILLVPEIALVPALAQEAREKFGDRVAILHSGLSRNERHQEWERIRRGEARVVLGPRSAVFAPVRELGLIVVDEEQDSSYKQDQTPRYHGRDLALWRGRQCDATVAIVSATPSLESRLNVERGKIQPLLLTQRVGHGRLPESILVDLREEGAVRRPGEITFSTRLLDELGRTLESGAQAILLRNRRGYAPVLLCRACGEDMRCDDCGLPKTHHLRDHRLVCHYCGSSAPIPATCPSCGKEAMEPMGAGTERVEEELGQLFPGVPIDVLDRDVVRRRGSVAAVLERFAAGESRILVGTQMVAKGHHFPRVALAGVLLADTYLGFPDFRAVERTYSLLTQLAGRAGRGDLPGRVVIQTFHPEHYAIRAALEHDDEGFAKEELRFRRIFQYPPYTRMVQILVRDTNRDRARAAISELADDLARNPLAAGLRIMGPAPAPFERLRGKWRFQLLLRGPSGNRIRALLGAVLPGRSTLDMVIDVDPYELL